MWKRIDLFKAVVIAAVLQQILVLPSLYRPILPHKSHFVVGLWCATDPRLPLHWLTFTPNYGVMVSYWIFWFVASNYRELKSFLEMVLGSSASWLTYWFYLYEPWLACKNKFDFGLFFILLDYIWYIIMFEF